ncbi:hypothetical protein FBU30_008391 [Linnemannia zychae]|nr:hypothetical protein FBU30_008391 [Linnemannia zychae]
MTTTWLHTKYDNSCSKKRRQTRNEATSDTREEGNKNENDEKEEDDDDGKKEDEDENDERKGEDALYLMRVPSETQVRNISRMEWNLDQPWICHLFTILLAQAA